jgi:hypothetical protein
MFLSAENYSDIKSVEVEYPSAVAIEKVDGGWMVFDNATDHKTWQGQS